MTTCTCFLEKRLTGSFQGPRSTCTPLARYAPKSEVRRLQTCKAIYPLSRAPGDSIESGFALSALQSPAACAREAREAAIFYIHVLLHLSTLPVAGDVGFPSVFWGGSYRIRILMYRDVSTCMYPDCTCILMCPVHIHQDTSRYMYIKIHLYL